MKSRATIALSVLTLVGCENMGLEYAGTGEEGRNRAPTELVSAVHQAAPATTQPIIAGGRRWVPGGEPIALDAAELRSVGSSAGQTVYARHWDDAPFDMLFIRTRPSGADGPSGTEGQQETQDTVSDAESPGDAESAGDAGSPGVAGSPGTAGARGTSAPSGPSSEAEWQPLVPVIGEDGGQGAQGAPAAH